MSSRDGKVVVITGARGQVGSALARHLHGQVPLALVDHALHPVGEAVPEGSAVFGGVDLGSEAAVEACVAAIRTQCGPIGGLVHTVGGYAAGAKVAAQPLSLVERMITLNFLTAVHMVKAVLPDVLAAGQGRIVLFASNDALRGHGGASAYGASKAALLRYAEALADEVTPHGVGVRVIVPSTIDTPPNRAAMPDARFDDWVSPDEIAHTVGFLLSPASSGIRYAAVPLGR